MTVSATLSNSVFCREQAADCAQRAEQVISPEIKARFQALERKWLESADFAANAEKLRRRV